MVADESHDGIGVNSHGRIASRSDSRTCRINIGRSGFEHVRAGVIEIHHNGSGRVTGKEFSIHIPVERTRVSGAVDRTGSSKRCVTTLADVGASRRDIDVGRD